MSLIQSSWQSRGLISSILWPLSLLYRLLLSLRRFAYKSGWIQVEEVPLPVVVVGNLSVGGTGKTPLCAYLVEHFKSLGWKPAIVSRGYGGQRHENPYLLTNTDTPEVVGDEPAMLLRQTQVPVCVCINRSAAVRKIATDTEADIVFSDDGLQHLAMPRVAEILVVDGQRGFGNRWIMPAGPLRDSFASLNSEQYVAIRTAPDKIDNHELPVKPDFLHPSLSAGSARPVIEPQISNQFALMLSDAVQISSGHVSSVAGFQNQRVHAVAGIGFPDRFFDSLRQIGIDVIEHPKPDHAPLSMSDLSFEDNLPILVTAKDAIKIQAFKTLPDNLFRVDTTVQISSSLVSAIEELEITLSRLQS